MFSKILKLWNSKFNPLGNYDDPVPPQKYFDKYGWFAYPYWYFLRNPLHNFCRYWIGTGSYSAAWKVWHPKRKWNLILPFFSYRGNKIEFYLGWRPKSDGSQLFGIAFRKRGSK